MDQKFPINSIFISDSRFHGQLTFSPDKTIFIDANEPNKSLETCVQVLIKLQELGANKNTELVAIGGGIVQDVVTLVASLYMRGISWIYFPTTKMSQLDSCMGGKSSINLNPLW
jgi:3-dehydroquinate synthase